MAAKPPESKADNPEFVILGSAGEIDVKGKIISIRVVKAINKVPEAEILMLDGDPATGDYEISDGSDFNPGEEIEIQAGYQQQYKTIFKGVVIKHGIKSSSKRNSTLSILLKHKVVAMTTTRKSDVYMNKTDSDIIEQLLNNASIDGTVDSTKVTHKQMVQYNCSDWDFMNMRAEACGLMVAVSDKVEVKKMDTSGTEAVEVTYGDNIVDFEAEIDGRYSFSEFSGKSWSYANQEMTEASPDVSGLTELGDLSADTIASSLSQSKYEVLNGAFLFDSEMQNALNALKIKSSLAKIRGRVRFLGIAEIEAGNVIKLDKLGKKFSGSAIVSGVLHELAPGKWLTNVQFGTNTQSYSEQYNDINQRPAGGLLAAISGLQIGVVSQIDSDPDGEDRVLVKLPSANTTEDALWARVASLDAGKERGSFFRPEKDDEVVLGFINSDPRNAIILGMLNSSKLPAPLKADSKNPQKGFITREKIKLIFDDDKKKVIIETPGGNTIVVDDDKKSILIQDQNNNKIELSDKGISLESGKDIKLKASGDVKIEGVNVELKASANFKAEGSAGLKLESSAIAEVKGSLVKIN